MIPIAVAYGDGIGPEIMGACLHVLEKAGAPLEFHKVEVGEKVYLRGESSGIEPKTWEVLRKTKAFLKAPITTPQGGGYRSLNVTIRTAFGLYANIRPCVSYAPFIQSRHPPFDLVIIRENEEDLYIGTEYQETPSSAVALKLISREGSERIIRYAFDYARAHGRKRVTAMMKDNILKFTDGLFHKVFDEVALEYPDIEHDHWIVDIGMAKVAASPEAFDVIVLPNLYGDILSDITAQISGSVGLVGSANIGMNGAMFEAIHGSAPRHAGKNTANPTALILAAAMMLRYLDQEEVALRIHNAFLCLVEEGIHTYDIYKEGVSREKVGTKEFAEKLVRHLGESPKRLKPAARGTPSKLSTLHSKEVKSAKRTLVGVDLSFHSSAGETALVKKVTAIESPSPLKLQMITNRGVRVWPDGHPKIACIDAYRVRFMHEDPLAPVTQAQIVELYRTVSELGFDIIKAQNLFAYDGKAGFSSGEDL